MGVQSIDPLLTTIVSKGCADSDWFARLRRHCSRAAARLNVHTTTVSRRDPAGMGLSYMTGLKLMAYATESKRWAVVCLSEPARGGRDFGADRRRAASASEKALRVNPVQ